MQRRPSEQPKNDVFRSGQPRIPAPGRLPEFSRHALPKSLQKEAAPRRSGPVAAAKRPSPAVRLPATLPAPTRPSGALLRAAPEGRKLPAFDETLIGTGAEVMAPRVRLRPPPRAAAATEPSCSVGALDADASLALDAGRLSGERWVVVDDGSGRAQAAATLLRQMGATVESCSAMARGRELERIAALDAAGYLFSKANAASETEPFSLYPGHSRLRWVRAIAVDWDELFGAASSKVLSANLLALLSKQRKHDARAFDALHSAQTLPLQTLGPARALRMAARHSDRRRVEVEIADARGCFSVTLSRGAVVGLARDGTPTDGAALEATIDQLLHLSEGTVRLKAFELTPPVGGAAETSGAADTELGSLDALLARVSLPTTPNPDGEGALLFRHEFAYDQTILQLPNQRAADAGAFAAGGCGLDAGRPRDVHAPSDEKSRTGAEPNLGALPSFGLDRRRFAWAQRPAVWVAGATVLLTAFVVVVLSSRDAPLGTLAKGSTASLTLAHRETSGSDSVVAGAAINGSIDSAGEGALATTKPASRATGSATSEQAGATTEVTLKRTDRSAQLPPAPNMDPSQVPALQVAEKGLAPPRSAGPAPNELLTDACKRWMGEPVKPLARDVDQGAGAWRLARRALLKGDLDVAERWLCWSANRDPKGPGTADLARLYLTREDQKSARHWAELALAEQPHDPKRQQLLADVAHRAGDVAEARELLLQSVNAQPSDVHLPARVAKRWVKAGKKAQRAGDRHQAERLFRRAIAVDPQHTQAAVSLARLGLEGGEPQQAANWARHAVAADANAFAAQVALGEAEHALGNTAAAREAWKAALALNPGSQRVRSWLKRE